MPIERHCEECGKPFVAKTRRARFCSDKCRVYANRRPTKTGRAKQDAGAAPAEVVELRPTGTDGAAPSTSDADGGLAAQIRATLRAVGAFETVAGMSALMLARQIDKGQDSGSAVATMTKELSRLMTEARAEAAPTQRDGADDVMARAAEKLLRLVQ